ncbi:MAG TPA: aspartyl protease [Candidatus Altiarchaeales archaeon]|nr:aspartyl protease [Candidatus Altiarchaeales archaeon]
MGHSWVEVEVSNLERTKSKRVKALVDTGVTLTVLPEKLAKELEIKPLREEKVMTGAGLVKVRRGEARIKLLNKEAPFDVWISDFIDKVLLGVIVLEALGFKVDPKTGKLEETPLLLY